LSIPLCYGEVNTRQKKESTVCKRHVPIDPAVSCYFLPLMLVILLLFTLIHSFFSRVLFTRGRSHLIFKIGIDIHRISFFFLSTILIGFTTVGISSAYRKWHHREVLLLHTRAHSRESIHSLAWVGNRDFWAAQQDRETDTKREREWERERKFCVYSECASPHGKRRRRRRRKREDEVIITAKATVLLSLMRKKWREIATHIHTPNTSTRDR
jgi:hypothetical protein